MPGPMEDASAKEDGTSLNKRGVKRPADESNLNDEQRFTKRFNLLSLDPRRQTNSYAYIPVQVTDSANGLPTAQSANAQHHVDESMQVDDTKDRVYIGDLDAEIAEIDAHEPRERLIFLPDIEKHFSRIPQHVLVGGRQHTSDLGHERQELVLYDTPRSLTLDASQDSVRRAILDARHRAREKAAEEARQEDMRRKYSPTEDVQHAVETAHGYSNGYVSEELDDPDAMDIG